MLAVITQPDKPGKRGKRLVASPVKALATSRGLPVLQPRRLRASDIADFHADVLVVVAYGQILKAEVLKTPATGCINVHASLLPRWRGAAPIQRAIMTGDRQTGVSIMAMDEGLDTGAVYIQQTVEIATDDTSRTLADKLAAVGSKALAQTLDRIAAGDAHTMPQPTEGVTWANKITKEEAHLDWRRSATQLAREIRALNPDPIAYGFVGDLRVKIWQAREGAPHTDAAAGEIVSFTREGIEVACGEGTIMLTRVQLPIGKGTILGAADLINGGRRELTAGNHFS